MRPDFLNEALPVEFILDIRKHLGVQDRWALMRTCRGLHQFLEQILWRPAPGSSHAEQWLRVEYSCIVQNSHLAA